MFREQFVSSLQQLKSENNWKIKIVLNEVIVENVTIQDIDLLSTHYLNTDFNEKCDMTLIVSKDEPGSES